MAKDRETGRAKGFAFISFQERADAAKACEKIDGCKCFPKASFLVTVHIADIIRWLWSLDSACRIRKARYLDKNNEMHFLNKEHKRLASNCTQFNPHRCTF